MELRILLVEDNPGDVDLIQILLPETGPVSFQVESAKRLSEARERLAKDNSIDLILLDLGLPDSGGLDTFRNLKALDSHIPIIILTGDTNHEAAVTAVQEGAQDFLIKGQITSELIVRSILYALERKRTEEKLHRQIAITAAINQILQYPIKARTNETVVTVCLSEAKKLTGSPAGWVGEINQSGDMVTAAVDPSDWDFSSFLAAEKAISKDLGIRGIFESAMNDGQSLLINNPGQDPHLAELLNEYPQLTALLVVPLQQNDRIVGMIVVVNKPSGYAPYDQKALEALSQVLSESLQRRRNDAELELLRAAIEQAGETIVITDTNGTIQYVNPAFTKITGYDKAEVIGKTTRILKSGQQDRAFYATLWNTITQGETFKARMVNKRKDGSFFTEDITISPVCNAAGSIVNYVAVKRDVTEHIRLEASYQHAQKLEAIGTLAGGIAHDFNNILTGILGYTELAAEEVGEQSKAGKDLQQVYVSASRAVDLVKQILTISRQVEKQKQPVRIQNIIKEVLKLLRPSITTSIEIKSTVDPECPTIMADATEMYQVIMNLCTNAYHAMRDTQSASHVLEIQLAPVPVDENKALILGHNIAPGRFVKLSISDTGCGMNAEVMNKIFDPYFTTKKLGEGTGLGLALVNSIITRAGGAITVASTPGQGTTFSIYVPAAEEHALQPRIQPTINIEQLKGTERIMIVDDEEAIVGLLKRMLAELGYQIAAFTDCADAMIAFKQDPLAFDLLITDLNMPKMMGTDLAKAFLAVRPDLPIILCTGYSETVATDTVQALGIKKCLFKPVGKDILVGLVRNLLDEKKDAHTKE